MKFDWDQALKQGHRAEWLEWLKEFHNKPMTLKQYTNAYREMRYDDPRPGKAKRYSTSRVKKMYEDLQSRYGFFQ